MANVPGTQFWQIFLWWQWAYVYYKMIWPSLLIISISSPQKHSHIPSLVKIAWLYTWETVLRNKIWQFVTEKTASRPSCIWFKNCSRFVKITSQKNTHTKISWKQCLKLVIKFGNFLLQRWPSWNLIQKVFEFHQDQFIFGEDCMLYDRDGRQAIILHLIKKSFSQDHFIPNAHANFGEGCMSCLSGKPCLEFKFDNFLQQIWLPVGHFGSDQKSDSKFSETTSPQTLIPNKS